MVLLKFLDSKFSFDRQRSFLNSFIFFGMPIGYLIVQGITIWSKGWDKYNFNIGNLFFSIIINLLIVSPLIVNYIIQRKKYNLIIKKFQNKTLSFKVKAIMNYSISLNSSNFVKGEIYDIQILNLLNPTWFRNKCYIMIINNNQWRSTNNFYDIINKFELVDTLKEERKNKLEKLQKIMK